MKRVLPILVVMLFLAGIFITPVGVAITPSNLQNATLLNDVTLEQDIEQAWLSSDKDVRVAIYSESNYTAPDYATYPGVVHNNATGLQDILMQYNYDATLISTDDILNHQLTTANYDVFALVDTFPRESITNQTYDFWAGGGGLLVFDGSIGYLTYFGILPPETAGDHGSPGYWDFASGDFKITTRHPVSKGYQTDEIITTNVINAAVWDWTALQASAIGSDLTMIVESSDNSNEAAVLAYDPSTGRGGKIVTFAMDNDGVTCPQMDKMIADAVEWMTPSPKGRVLYDLSHDPYYGVDSYDGKFLTNGGDTHLTLRSDIVANGYTFDKLYPSASGNLTAANLAPYDVLIECLTLENFTSQEVSVVTSWISSGGALLCLSDQVDPQRLHLNYLLSNTHIQVNTTTGGNHLLNVGEHVIHENVASGGVVSSRSLDVTSPAYPIMEGDVDHWVIAVEEYSAGRISVIGDVGLLRDSSIGSDDNRQLGINIINWLTAGDVLIFIDETMDSQDPNYPNPYRGPIASALNSLGIPFLLTETLEYFNLSLTTESWELVAFDQPSNQIATTGYSNNILNYMKAGGKMAISSWQMSTSSYPAVKPLWDYLGVGYGGDSFATPPTIYLWDIAHPVFSKMGGYDADNLTTSRDIVGIDCANLTVYANGTAIAGLDASAGSIDASIVLGANGRAITNGMHLTAYSDDTDDSTYYDSFEIWRGEIAYLMRSTINSPGDMIVEYGDDTQTITWTPESDRPFTYSWEIDSVVESSEPWSGGQIVADIIGLNPGTYVYEATVSDTAGYSITDLVTVTVEDTVGPAWIDAPDNLQYEEGTAVHILNWSYSELLPDSYWVLIDNVTVKSDSWDGSEISVDAGGLTEGVYNVTLAVNDTSGNWASSWVTLIVTEEVTTTISPTTTETETTTDTETETTTETDTSPIPGGYEVIIIIIVAGVVIVIIIIIVKKKS